MLNCDLLSYIYCINLCVFVYEKIAQKEVQPPYIPTLDPGDPYMTTNFDDQFTREPPELTPDDP